MDNAREITAARLKSAREYLGLSQHEVAEKLQLPRSAISLIETGQRRVDVAELQALARLYERPIAYFTGEEEAPVLPSDVEILTRKAEKLSPEDRETLLRYTEFLLQQAAAKARDDK
jgi:transcriptional regulator with XRE-family HTH domain